MPRAFVEGQVVRTCGVSFVEPLFDALEDYIEAQDRVSRSRVISTAVQEFLLREASKGSKKWKKRDWTLQKQDKKAKMRKNSYKVKL